MQKVIAICLFTVVMLVLGMALASSASVLSPFDGPGYGTGVTEAVTMADHTRVYLTCVTCSKIEVRRTPNYYVVRDSLGGGMNAAIIVCSVPPHELKKLGQNLDVSGELVTLENGYRALINPRVFAYLDENSQIIYSGSLFRGLLTAPWPNLREIFSPPTMSTQSVHVLDDGDPGIPGGDPTPDAPLNVVFCNTISDARSAYSPDSRVLVQIDAHPISDPSTDTGTFNLVEPDSSGDSISVCYSGVGNMASSDNANTCVATVQLDSAGSAYLELDQGPNFMQGDQPGWVQDIPHNLSIGDARAHQWPYTTPLEPLEVTTSPGDFGGAFYAQGFVAVNSAGQIDSAGTIHHTGGIRVVYSGTPPALGAVVDVTGTTTKASDGESVIDSVGSVQVDTNYTGTSAPPIIKPLFMSTAMLGGSGFNSYWPGVTGGSGVYNKGMLAKIAGKVTASDPVNQAFWVDDGCGLSDGSGNIGVKISWQWSLGSKTAIVPPAVGWTVSVVGIVSSGTSNSGASYFRILRPRNQSDIVVLVGGTLSGGSPAPNWAEDTIPYDSADVDEGGPSSADSVDLATGAGENNPDPDIVVSNPVGPDAVFARKYRSTLAEAGYCSPGLSPGWVHNYDARIQGTTGSWSSLTLTYPNGATENLQPTLSGGYPTGSFAASGSPYIVTGQTDGATGRWSWIQITFQDETIWRFTPTSANPDVYLLTRITDAQANYISVNYVSGSNTLSSITDKTGKTLMSLGYSGAYLNTVSDVSVSGSSRQITFTFGQQVGTTCLASVSIVNNASKAQWNYGYTAINNCPHLTWVEAPDPTGGSGMRGHPIYYALDGRVQELVDANNNLRSYLYNGSSTQVSVKDSTGALVESWTQKIGSQHQDMGTIDAKGNATSITYTGTYLPSGFTNKDNQTSAMTYDPTGNTNYGRLRTIIDPRGLVTTLSYTDSAHPFRVTSEQVGTKTATTFDYYSGGASNGLVSHVYSPTPGTSGTGSTVTTTYTYTTLGNMQTITSPSDGNSVLTSVYDYTSDPDYSISGVTEVLGQPLRVTVYEGTQSGGHVISRAHFRYDNHGRLSEVIDATGNKTDYGYNDADQVTDIWYPPTTTNQNARAHLVYTYHYTGGDLQSTDLYDESGTAFRHVAATKGNEAELLAQSGSLLQANYAYDAMYRAKQITDGRSNTTHFHYDTVGNPDSVTYPSGSGMAWGFDADENVNQRTDGKNQVTNYTLDPIDSRLNYVNYPTGTSPHFLYDIYGRVTSMTDSTGTVGYAYDDNNLITSITTTYAGLSSTQTVQYIYNSDGSKASMTISGLNGSPNSITYSFTYGYDTSHNQRTVALTSPWFGLQQGSIAYQVDTCYYDWNGRISERDLGDLKTIYTYDARGRLASLNNNSASYYPHCVSNFTSIVHDVAGNLTDLTYYVPWAWWNDSSGYFSTVNLSGQAHYQYDYLDRLTGEQRNDQNSAYSYNLSFLFDSAGNPQTVRDQSFTYNSNNQVSDYTYDNNGSCTNYRGYSATYDYEDLPKTITNGSSTVTMAFRADGLRAYKTSYGSTKYFLYDGDKVICEINSQGNLIRGYAYGPTGLQQSGIYTQDYTWGPIGAYTYTYDPIGSLVKSLYQTNNDDQLNYGCDRTTVYDAFGRRWWDYNGYDDNYYNSYYPYPATFNDSVGFHGQTGTYTDPETVDSTGTPLVLMGVRYYDPISGRFTGRDPLAGDVTDYAFCEDNPVERVDPDGMDWVHVAADFSAAWGDALTFGMTGRVRMWIGANGGDAVRQNTGPYLAGTGVGIVHDTLMGGALVKGAARGLSKVALKVVPKAAEVAEVGGRILRSERGAIGVGRTAEQRAVDRVIKLAKKLNEEHTVLTEASAKRLTRVARSAGVRKVEDISMGHPNRVGSYFEKVKHIKIGKWHIKVK